MPRPRVAVVGASGSIGLAVCEDLARDHDVVALTRYDPPDDGEHPDSPIDWRRCDLFARGEIERALADSEFAVYLVHTRLSSARLDQAQCEDMDLIIADNVALAAGRNGIRQIICLRGLLPEGELPPALRERRNEVVQALGSYGVPVTVLRASLVVAPGSSSVNLIASIVRHARVVPIPRWALARKQPLALPDLLRAVRRCLGDPEMYGGRFDIGGPEVMDFRGILREADRLLGRQSRILVLPWLPSRIYAGWVQRRSPRTHPALVRLVVEDLRYEMTARDNPLQAHIADGSLRCRHAIEPYLEGTNRKRLANPRATIHPVHEAQLKESSTVRSIQRLRLPPARNASWVADRYFRWLPEFVWPFVVCETGADGSCIVRLRWPRTVLLHLKFRPGHSTPARRMFFIVGGLLADRERNHLGRMEFHDVLDGRYCIVAIHDYAPALPWNFYHWTQAVGHGFVMAAFQRYMDKLSKGDRE